MFQAKSNHNRQMSGPAQTQWFRGVDDPFHVKESNGALVTEPMVAGCEKDIAGPSLNDWRSQTAANLIIRHGQFANLILRH